MVWSLPEGYESSPPFWDAPYVGDGQKREMSVTHSLWNELWRCDGQVVWPSGNRKNVNGLYPSLGLRAFMLFHKWSELCGKAVSLR